MSDQFASPGSRASPAALSIRTLRPGGSQLGGAGGSRSWVSWSPPSG